jgi:hypothetical protein
MLAGQSYRGDQTPCPQVVKHSPKDVWVSINEDFAFVIRLERCEA